MGVAHWSEFPGMEPNTHKYSLISLIFGFDPYVGMKRQTHLSGAAGLGRLLVAPEGSGGEASRASCYQLI